MEKYVICLNNEGYAASLEVRKLYERLPDPKAEAMHCTASALWMKMARITFILKNFSCRWKSPNRYPSPCIN